MTLLAGLAATAAAQPRAPGDLDAPWTDVAPTIDGDRVWAAAVGAPDERIRRFEARRASARRMARRRATEAIHAWADDALARAHAGPRQARAVHDAIDEGLRVRTVRPLVDAGAVVSVEVPLAALREACDREGLPWVR